MNYLHALQEVHRILLPRNYVEIGCREGKSLALANCPSVAIDPDFEVRAELTAPTKLYRRTSDAFFRQENLTAVLGGPFDLDFVDGMHLAEFALRDILNLERHATAASVIVVDDVLPERMGWATREKKGKAWTGDVNKVIPFLRQQRPDLSISVFDIELKGLAIISNLDPKNRKLQQNMAQHEDYLRSNQASVPRHSDLRSLIDPAPTESLTAYLRELGEVRANQGLCQEALA